MSELTLTKIRFRHGIWEGRVTGADRGAQPAVKVLHMDKPVPGVALDAAPDDAGWDLKVPVPRDAIADGVQTFVIVDSANDSKLGDFTLVVGDAATDDLRGEVELLRAELDMLKRAFRRHCLETM